MPRKDRKLNVFVPRLMDEDNTNAQNLNAKAMLARFDSPDIQWHTVYYNKPDPKVCGRDNVTCHRLMRRRFWQWHLFAMYLRGYDAIFYPGNEWYDAAGLKCRKKLRKNIPIIATLEGIPGEENREAVLSDLIGHKVFCFRPRSGPKWIEYHDRVKQYSTHVIAISPFLSEVSNFLYKKNTSVLPLGVDTNVFFSNENSREDLCVVCAGTIYDAKRPKVFIKLARTFSKTKFIWYGDGENRNELIEMAQAEGLNNISFYGAVTSADLSAKFREASFFVLPSLSEGVPKVTQEAAACGLPVILFGYYEAPSVNDGLNGFVVWSDQEMFDRVGELITDRNRCLEMGRQGALLSEQLDWEVVAVKWEKRILGFVS